MRLGTRTRVIQRKLLVSIHASVKDATMCDWAISMMEKVSIHASVKDATKNEKGIKG